MRPVWTRGSKDKHTDNAGRRLSRIEVQIAHMFTWWQLQRNAHREAAGHRPGCSRPAALLPRWQLHDPRQAPLPLSPQHQRRCHPAVQTLPHAWQHPLSGQCRPGWRLPPMAVLGQTAVLGGALAWLQAVRLTLTCDRAAMQQSIPSACSCWLHLFRNSCYGCVQPGHRMFI